MLFFIYSFFLNVYLLSSSYVPGTLLEGKQTEGHKIYIHAS